MEEEDLRAHGAVVLPGLLKLIALDIAKSTSDSNTAGKVGASNLLHETQTADLVLPVCDVCFRTLVHCSQHLMTAGMSTYASP
jgi:hypothetical protein